ncbi:MAG: helix-turn-helix domain-containing protein [Candidatus Nealsonbacteria bacterium]|nr:helix-turn-helix domain-containing protein [Candidatus Nealsonbacteria bacterium]
MKKDEQYISLQEAAKHCEYSQEYLSLRARQGKLKAIKIGRNWIVKKEWLEDYLKRFNNKNKNGNNFLSEKLPQALSKPKEALVFPKEKFSFPTIKQYYFLNRKFSIPLVKHRPFSIKEFYFSKKSDLFIFKKIGLNFARTLLVIFLISGGFFIFQKFEAKNFIKKSAAGISQEIFLIVKTIDLKDVQAASVIVFKEYGQWLLSSFKNLPTNIAKSYSLADKFVEKKLKGGYELVVDFLKPKKEIAQEKTVPLPKETLEEKSEEGLVVLPYEGEGTREEIAKKIKASFSDEIKVEQKDESSGIITPIFRDQKEGDKYLYVLVPLKN